MSAIKQFFVEADQGPLQVEFQEGQARLPVVILCHPHPLYGGSMHDGVLEAAANTAQSLGFGWLRFNFRGVGASAGTHIPSADEPAETADLAAVLSWLADNTSHQTYITLGYSFGAYVICHSAPHPNLQRRILVAPPNAVMQCPMGASAIPLDIIYGSADDYVDPGAFPAGDTIATHMLPAADHFFSGQHDALASALTGIFSEG